MISISTVNTSIVGNHISQPLTSKTYLALNLSFENWKFLADRVNKVALERTNAERLRS